MEYLEVKPAPKVSHAKRQDMEEAFVRHEGNVRKSSLTPEVPKEKLNAVAAKKPADTGYVRKNERFPEN